MRGASARSWRPSLSLPASSATRLRSAHWVVGSIEQSARGVVVLWTSAYAQRRREADPGRRGAETRSGRVLPLAAKPTGLSVVSDHHLTRTHLPDGAGLAWAGPRRRANEAAAGRIAVEAGEHSLSQVVLAGEEMERGVPQFG